MRALHSTDLACRPRSTVTRGTLPPTPGAETGLPPSQSVRKYTRVSSTRSLVGKAECTTFQTFSESNIFKCLAQGKSVTIGIRTHTLLLTVPELGSDELHRSAATWHKTICYNWLHIWCVFYVILVLVMITSVIIRVLDRVWYILFNVTLNDFKI